jgi:flagellar basal-body rod modification protein FlgD
MSVTAASPAIPTSTATTTAGSSALDNLSSNFQDFLTLLMTQLQNQDPTSPMDSNTFTQELVSFTGVEQQIETNSNLSSLIQLTQSNDLLSANGLVGKTVQISTDQIVLQGGSGTIDFTAPADGPVQIAVTDSTGRQIASTTVTATAGNNTWTWNGAETSGATAPDGGYNVSVTTAGANGASSSLSFDSRAKVTGVQIEGGAIELELGTLTVPFDSIAAVVN